MYEYKLTRGKRKSIEARVCDGVLEVRAPFAYPKSKIDEFVASREKWIGKHLTESIEKVEKRASFSLAYGDKVTYRGKEFPIVGKPGNMAGFNVVSFYMPADLTPDDIKYYCIRTFRLLAEKDLIPWTLEIAGDMSVQPSSIRVNNAKTRWGSCSAQRRMNFAWRLIMADDEVIEYMIVHELAHMIEYNHSARFWEVVQCYVPDYRERKERLKALQHKLSFEDWEYP